MGKLLGTVRREHVLSVIAELSRRAKYNAAKEPEPAEVSSARKIVEGWETASEARREAVINRRLAELDTLKEEAIFAETGAECKAALDKARALPPI